MKARLVRWISDAWYTEMYISSWFMPLSMLYVDVVRFRRFLYRIGILKKTRLPVPVIIIGNISVGGTGKTPLVIWMAAFLARHGYRPGVISRGYAGAANKQAQIVSITSSAQAVGDEAVVLAQRCDCPVAIGVDRVAAANLLVTTMACNIIVSDDGLQHYALQRDVEIAVIDGQRRFGNGYCLPVGPLREPQERLKQVDFVVVNGGDELEEGEISMRCLGDELINLHSGEHKALADFKQQPCHALAAIGNPQRFFKQLSAAGITCETQAFPDHYQFTAADLHFKDGKPVLMTEKDAVKCRDFASDLLWYLPITAEMPEAFSQQLLTLLQEKSHG